MSRSRSSTHRTLVLAVVAAAALALAAAIAAGCGDPEETVPPPEVVATAEAGATHVSFTALPATTPIPEDETEPVTLDGRIFGSGPTAVILAHTRLADQTSWFPYARRLAATGEFTVLTFDFRGYNDSTGDKQFDRIDADIEAAYNFMRDDRGFDKIFLVGASMGGTASLVVAERVPLAGVISISAPSDFRYLDAVGPVANVDAPKLFILSEDDVPAVNSHAKLWAAAPEPREEQIYPGKAHGTELFDGPVAAAFEKRMTDFLRAH